MPISSDHTHANVASEAESMDKSMEQSKKQTAGRNPATAVEVPRDRPPQDEQRHNDAPQQPYPNQLLEDHVHKALEEKLISLIDNESTNREILWLRRQVNWSIGFLVVLIIILGGAFTWFIYTLRNEEQPMSPDASTAIAPLDTQRLEKLEAQIQSLNDRIPEDLGTTLSTNGEELRSLSEQLDAVAADIGKNQQTLTNLENSLEAIEQSMVLKAEDEAAQPSNPSPNNR